MNITFRIYQWLPDEHDDVLEGEAGSLLYSTKSKTKYLAQISELSTKLTTFLVAVESDDETVYGLFHSGKQVDCWIRSKRVLEPPLFVVHETWYDHLSYETKRGLFWLIVAAVCVVLIILSNYANAVTFPVYFEFEVYNEEGLHMLETCLQTMEETINETSTGIEASF